MAFVMTQMRRGKVEINFEPFFCLKIEENKREIESYGISHPPTSITAGVDKFAMFIFLTQM